LILVNVNWAYIAMGPRAFELRGELYRRISVSGCAFEKLGAVLAEYDIRPVALFRIEEILTQLFVSL
jgi:hypothetical protein